jgi:hypothetical protein
MLEADEAEFPELHPTKKTAHKAASVMIGIVLKKTEQTFLTSCDCFIKPLLCFRLLNRIIFTSKKMTRKVIAQFRKDD